MNTLYGYLKLRPELVVDDQMRTCNRLIDPVWKVQQANNLFQVREIDFTATFGEISAPMEVFIKQVFAPENEAVSWVRFTRLENGMLEGSPHNVDKLLGVLKVIVAVWKDSGFETLAEWDHNAVLVMFASALEVKTEGGGSSGQIFKGVRSHSYMESLVRQYQAIRTAYVHEYLNDGFLPPISEAEILDKLVNQVAPRLNEEFEYARWVAGMKLDGLSVAQSVALLMSCLNFLRSDKTRLIVTALHITHSELVSDSSIVVTKLRDGSFFSLHAYKTASKAKRQAFENIVCEVFGIDRFDELPEEIRTIRFDREIKGSWGEASTHARALVPMAMLVIAIITGARRNELESIQWGDIYLEKDGIWRFCSDINKTNQGLSTVRYLGGIAAEMVDFLRQLNAAINPELKGAMFSQTTLSPSTNPTNVAGKGFMLYLKKHIDWFINPMLADDLQIKEFNIHSLRHAWAEFALRRFEGTSVPELVRQHFRHHWGSYMTKKYLHGKVFEEDGRNLHAEYITDMVGRAASGDLHIYGPVGDFIKAQIEGYQFVSDSEIKSIVERFSGVIEPHEYGFCIVRPETISTAQCYDKDSQMARTEDACWEKCGRCVNRLTLPEHREDIHRLGISIKAGMDSFTKLGLIPMANIYEASLRQVEVALNEIDAGERAHV